MKITNVLLFFLLIIVPTAALASDVDEVVISLRAGSPPGWQIHFDPQARPPWTRSDERCLKLEFYGPALGGYKYMDVSGHVIAERRFAHEAVVVWVTPKGFYTGWNPVTRLLNWFAPWGPVEFPKTIGDYNGVHVYAQESYFYLHKEWRDPSPTGTVTAIFCPPEGGRTWRTWEAVFRKALKR
jgi:hypothetical protein